MFWIALEMNDSLLGLIIGLSLRTKNKPRLEMKESQNLATLVPGYCRRGVGVIWLDGEMLKQV